MKTFSEIIMFKNSLSRIPFLLSFLLPFLIIFSRAIADITIIFVVILFLFNSYLEKNWIWIKSKWFLFAIIFWLYCLLIATPLSINVEKSFLYSFYFIRWPLFAMALYFWVFKDLDNFKNFLKVISLVFLFLCADSWLQYFNGFDFFGYPKFPIDRLTGPFDRPIIGMWLTKLFLFIPLMFYLNCNFKLKKISYNKLLVLSIFFILTIFISGERMALILSILTVLLLIFGLYLESLLSVRKILFSLITLFFGGVIFFIYDPVIFERSFISTIEKIINWRDSDYGIVWESAYMVWIKAPFFGSGFHSYREACDALLIYGTHNNPVGSGVCFHPHNISLELLSELGIIGFILFYFMVFYIFYDLFKINKNHHWFLLTIFLAIFISCFFPLSSGMSIFSNKLASIIWLIIGSLIAFTKLKIDTKS